MITSHFYFCVDTGLTHSDIQNIYQHHYFDDEAINSHNSQISMTGSKPITDQVAMTNRNIFLLVINMITHISYT